MFPVTPVVLPPCFLSFARAHGCDRHPAFPAPSVQERAKRRAKLGQNVSRECGCATHGPRHTLNVVLAKARTHYPKCRSLCDADTTSPAHNVRCGVWVRLSPGRRWWTAVVIRTQRHSPLPATPKRVLRATHCQSDLLW
ncbi:hypothetical protein XI02_42475 [Bradyrhizobium sp. CCBAU 21365]|nr:hypothetical protein XI02_42475 [Bradyrhizobium sp. CCBAU 21365]